MYYSNIQSRAGLVALVFALIISLVSAVPIPATESGLSSTFSSRRSHPSLNEQDLIQLNTTGTKISSSGIPVHPAASGARKHHTLPNTETDDELVRRTSVGAKIKHAFQKAGGAIKKGFQKAGNAIKGAAKKVGNFMKTTGAKVAKFGLKVVESVGNVVGKVASFIPAIGKPIDKAIEGVSKVAGVVSDHIHAKLSNKLQKGMNVMNKADKIMGYMPRRRDFSEDESLEQRAHIHAKHSNKLEKGMETMNKMNNVMGYIPSHHDSSKEETIREPDHIHAKSSNKLEKGMHVMGKIEHPMTRDFSEDEAFQQRDIGDAYYFEERDDIALEDREDSYFEGYERDMYERYDMD